VGRCWDRNVESETFEVIQTIPNGQLLRPRVETPCSTDDTQRADVQVLKSRSTVLYAVL
jgi:hypothetical protein